MVEVRGPSVTNYGGNKSRRRSGGTRSRLRCLVIPCSIFACVAGGSSLLLRWLTPTSETPSVRGATGAEVEVAAEGRGEGAAPGAPVVAYAISVTSLELPQASTMLDSAEVLIHSIRTACKFSRYRCETFAFALPSVGEEGLQHLESMGWRVLEKDLPVAVEDIEDEFYRNHVVKSGCCGANEFIKLHAYTLTDYHRVVHLDADALILHPMDELMESDASLVYTTDPAMATKGSEALPVQGGFLLVRPDMGVYDELRAIVRKGNWKVGAGWCGSRIGYFYGGATIQGLLPYYYNIVAPGRATEVNRCVYNHMSDSSVCRSARYTLAAIGTEAAATITMITPEATTQGEEGGETKDSKDGDAEAITASSSPVVYAIKSVHFTQSCTKPWFCGRVAAKDKQGSCHLLQQAWRDGRRDILKAKGLPLTAACVKGAYSPIPRSEPDVRG